MLQIEGCYHKKTTGCHKFKKHRSPHNDDIVKLIDKIRKRVIKLLIRLGYLQIHEYEQNEACNDPLFAEDSTYAEMMSCSVNNKIALGVRKGEKVRFIGPGFGYEQDTPKLKGYLCAESSGFSLHAGVMIKAHRRDNLKRLIGYVSRPPLCLDRLTVTDEGDIKYKFKRPWANGKTHVVLSPLEFIEKLCALVPQPRMHLVRYSGVLAPNSKMRSGVIPGMTRAEIKAQKEALKDTDKKLVSSHQWAKLLARVFEIDVSKCKHCGGELKIISAIINPTAIQKILNHLGLSPQPPPIAPARNRGIFATIS